MARKMTCDEIRTLALDQKDKRNLTWPELGKSIGRSPVYAALLVYGYGQATTEEAAQLSQALELPDEAKTELQKASAPHARRPERHMNQRLGM